MRRGEAVSDPAPLLLLASGPPGQDMRGTTLPKFFPLEERNLASVAGGDGRIGELGPFGAIRRFSTLPSSTLPPPPEKDMRCRIGEPSAPESDSRGTGERIGEPAGASANP